MPTPLKIGYYQVSDLIYTDLMDQVRESGAYELYRQNGNQIWNEVEHHLTITVLLGIRSYILGQLKAQIEGTHDH